MASQQLWTENEKQAREQSDQNTKGEPWLNTGKMFVAKEVTMKWGPYRGLNMVKGTTDFNTISYQVGKYIY